MTDTPKFTQSRRQFLAGAAVATGAAATGKLVHAQAAGPDPAIMEMQPWQQYLGPGVDAAPYGVPSPHEAHVIRRNVEWLTADTVSSVNFTPLHEMEGIITPNGLCFERHHSGVAEIDPGVHRLMINGLVDNPLVFTMEDLMRFPRENRAYFLECAANTGMEWRGSQLNGVQFTHGMIHNVVLHRRSVCDCCWKRRACAPTAPGSCQEGADGQRDDAARSRWKRAIRTTACRSRNMNGENGCAPEQGPRAALSCPVWEGNMWSSGWRRIEVGDAPGTTGKKTSKYIDLFADGQARRLTWKWIEVGQSPTPAAAPSPMVPVRRF